MKTILAISGRGLSFSDSVKAVFFEADKKLYESIEA